MIEQILQQVAGNLTEKLTGETGVSADQVPAGLESVSNTVMAKAKGYVEGGDLMKLKDIFLGGDDAAKESFMTDVKTDITADLGSKLGIDADVAGKFTDISIPEIINVAKEHLLGGKKFNLLTDGPKILSFFKSGGKEVKGGGLGSMFGF